MAVWTLVHDFGRLLVAATAGILLAGGSSAGTSSGALALDNGLARTPPMGFNGWNRFRCDVDEQIVEQVANVMVSSGMAADGYRYVNLDDCWMAMSRDGSGSLVADPTRFPHGMKALGDYVHAHGLLFGIYEDAGTKTCAGYPGSYGHERQDAATFAAWGADYLKYDWCSIPSLTAQNGMQLAQELYLRMRDALVATGRPMVFSMVNGWDGSVHPWLWAKPVANLWRFDQDIYDTYSNMLDRFHSDVLFSQYAGPGGWNDADMLEVGNGGMTASEYQSHFSLWSELAAPLIAGTDLRRATPETMAIYTNREVIAVDQDPLGRQGTVVSHTGGRWVLAKPMSDGSVAVVLFNESGAGAVISTSARAVGLASAPEYTVRDLWQHQTTQSSGALEAK